MKLVEPNDPVLTQEAAKVVLPNTSIRRIASDMMLTMLTQHGCGLAAPQVGLPLRMFVWSDGIESGVVINPIIVEYIDPTRYFSAADQVEFQEGCLTFPGKHYRTRRARSIWCNYFDVDGKPSGSHKIDGFRAIIFQHEYDHLIGRLLPHHGELVQEE